MIESEGSFTLLKLEAIINPWDEGLNKNNGNDNADMSVDFIAKHVRATILHYRSICLYENTIKIHAKFRR